MVLDEFIVIENFPKFFQEIYKLSFKLIKLSMFLKEKYYFFKQLTPTLLHTNWVTRDSTCMHTALQLLDYISKKIMLKYHLLHRRKKSVVLLLFLTILIRIALNLNYNIKISKFTFCVVKHLWWCIFMLKL